MSEDDVVPLPTAVKLALAEFEGARLKPSQKLALEVLRKSLEATTARLTAGLATRKRAGLKPSIDREQVKQLRNQGKSTKEIAEELGCSYDAIAKILRRFSVTD